MADVEEIEEEGAHSLDNEQEAEHGSLGDQQHRTSEGAESLGIEKQPERGSIGYSKARGSEGAESLDIEKQPERGSKRYSKAIAPELAIGERKRLGTLKTVPEHETATEKVSPWLQKSQKVQEEDGDVDHVPAEDVHRRPTLEFQRKLERIFNDGETTKHEQRQRAVRPRLQFFNTYQLDPFKKFRRTEVENCIGMTLNEILHGKKYCSTTASELTGTLAEQIRNRVLEFGYDRYKIIVLVSVGPKGRQGVEIGTQCFWDSNRDRYAHGSFESYYIFASACVYGIYFD